MQRKQGLLIAASLFATWARSSSARAEGFTEPEPEPQPIYNGEQAGICEFPTAVSLGSCTATLVHPELIIYAAHCGSNFGSVFFGNDTSGSGFNVSTDFCEVNPNWNGIGYGVDVAYCKLAEPVTEVPFTPPLMGCEVEVLQPGREVWIVGYGETDNGVYGVKHKAQTTFNYSDDNDDANIGGNGVTVCFGDSGGPTFVQLREADGFDGTWRAFGIASYVYTPCGTEGFSAMMHNGVAWVEQASGVDVTPCHDADGTWNPSAQCDGFPAGIDAGAGDWNAGCEPGPLGGLGATCGEPFGGGGADGGADDGAEGGAEGGADGGAEGGSEPGSPSVSITSPVDGSAIDLPPDEDEASVRVVVDASDNDGIAEVTLMVDGNEVASTTAPPFEFEVMLPAGEHVLEALAVDVGDASGHSSQVRIDVVADDEGGAVDDGNHGGDDGDNDDDSAMGPAVLPPGFGLDQEAPGCGCHADPRPGTPLGLAVILLARRRRRLGPHAKD